MPTINDIFPWKTSKKRPYACDQAERAIPGSGSDCQRRRPISRQELKPIDEHPDRRDCAPADLCDHPDAGKTTLTVMSFEHEGLAFNLRLSGTGGGV
jgi:hypothetical protein